MIFENTAKWTLLSMVGAMGLFGGLIATPAPAGPINSNVAFTPRKGGSILRLQYTYSEADVRADGRSIRASGVRATYVYGAREDLALFLSVPFVHREIDTRDSEGRLLEFRQDGLPDFTILAKYRFWQKDMGPTHTIRWAALAGLNVRSGDSDFTSNSYDPILGTVISWRRDRNHFDADLLYQFNTGGGRAGHDVLRYDLAYSFRLLPKVFRVDRPYALDAVAELNGRYSTDGSHEIYLSPGLQWQTERWVWEASVQIPIFQDLSDHAAESDYRVVLGLRFQW